MILFKEDSVPPLIIVFTPDNVGIMHAVNNGLINFGLDAIITGGMEGVHPGTHGDSEHYHGRALDFRVRDWPTKYLDGILKNISGHLDILTKTRTKILGCPVQYFYQLEGDHLHVERSH